MPTCTRECVCARAYVCVKDEGEEGEGVVTAKRHHFLRGLKGKDPVRYGDRPHEAGGRRTQAGGHPQWEQAAGRHRHSVSRRQAGTGTVGAPRDWIVD